MKAIFSQKTEGSKFTASISGTINDVSIQCNVDLDLNIYKSSIDEAIGEMISDFINRIDIEKERIKK